MKEGTIPWTSIKRPQVQAAMVTLANNIARRRLAAGLTREALAELCGTHARTIENIEDRKSVPSYVVVLWIAMILKCSMDDLARETLEPEIVRKRRTAAPYRMADGHVRRGR